MQKKYNIRDKKGQFVKLVSPSHSCACGKKKCGTNIVSGRLYDWKGVTVRAFGNVNGKRFISAHKSLTGLVEDVELKPITKQAVETYLAQAQLT